MAQATESRGVERHAFIKSFLAFAIRSRMSLVLSRSIRNASDSIWNTSTSPHSRAHRLVGCRSCSAVPVHQVRGLCRTVSCRSRVDGIGSF